jgi:glycosyltransferase involved in cell wall biosynthesis
MNPPAIAIISNSQTPYRLHLHRRIAAELPQLTLHSVYTHEISNSKWQFQAPPEIGPVLFGKGESCTDQDKPSRALREWRRGGRIIDWLIKNKIQFVVMMGYNDPGRMRIIRWCRRNQIPCFLFGDSNIHGDHPTGLKALVKKQVVGWVVRSCAGVLPCGSLGKAYFLKYGASPDRIFYFPYEPDYQLIRDLRAETIHRVKEKYALRDNRRRIVYSGRLLAHKRVDLLFNAFLTIAEQRPEWDLIVIGTGKNKDELLAMIPPALSDRFIWTGFIDDQQTISAIYRLSDLLVLPSDYEPWALVINEAVAAGLAIISSSVVGASAELVRDGINGRLFPAGDLPALTAALLEVTRDGVIQSMKQASPAVLQDWQTRGDPVQGLLAALKSVAILPNSG